MKPAEEISAAVEKIRTAAEAAHRASPAPWTITDEHVVRCADGMIVADRSGTDHPAERADLPYIAAMHPGIGQALAAWLDSWAIVDLREHATMSVDARHALKIARIINGTVQR